MSPWTEPRGLRPGTEAALWTKVPLVLFIIGYGLRFSSKDAYHSIDSPGMPGVKTKDFNLNLQKYTSITILSDEVWDEFIKNCNDTPGHNVFKGALFHLHLIFHLYFLPLLS